MTDDERATRYHRRQLVLAAAGLIVGLGYLLAVLASGVARDLAEAAARLVAAWWWQVGVVTIALGVGHELLVFPLTWTRGYALPRRYGLLHQSLLSWLADHLKAAALGGVLALGGIEVIYGLLRMTRWWWLAAAAVFFAGHVVMAVVVPIWVLPLFYRLRPLGPGPLRERLSALADRVGVPVVGVWIADQSRKSRTANAAVVGLGRTRRIVLFDTLVSGFPSAEIESILAHELGHHVHGDIRRGLLAQGLLTLATFALADVALGTGVRLWGWGGPADPAGVPWFALVVLVLGLVAMPLANTFSRWIERQADDFAVVTTADREAFVGAMERLARLNLAERRPHPIKEVMLYSHPAIDRRIARARAAVLGLVLCVGVTTSAFAQVSLESFDPTVGVHGLRPESAAIVRASSQRSMGLRRCAWNPAASVRSTPWGWPNAVMAIAGNVPPRSAGSVRTWRMSQ
jgi:STE24 endopeptidase